MPRTLTGFAPLGYVLLVMLGAGIAERTGLFGAAMRAVVRMAPARLLTPIVLFVGVMGNQAADAAFVILPPLAAALYAAAGRHPIARHRGRLCGRRRRILGQPAAGRTRRTAARH